MRCFTVLRAGVALLLIVPLSVACKADGKQTTTVEQVVVCESGIDVALQQRTRAEARSTYYRACSHVYTQPDCQQAFVQAADLEPSEQLPLIAEACRQVYCPALADRGLVLCMGGWLRDGRELRRQWQELNQAIIEYDAEELAPRVAAAMSDFDARVGLRVMRRQ
jgi:hypothetical protein